MDLSIIEVSYNIFKSPQALISSGQIPAARSRAKAYLYLLLPSQARGHNTAPGGVLVSL